MSSPAVSVAHTSAPTVTKRVSPVSVPNTKRLPSTYSNTSVKHPQGNKIFQFARDKPSVFCVRIGTISTSLTLSTHDAKLICLVCSEAMCVTAWEDYSLYLANKSVGNCW